MLMLTTNSWVLLAALAVAWVIVIGYIIWEVFRVVGRRRFESKREKKRKVGP